MKTLAATLIVILTLCALTGCETNTEYHVAKTGNDTNPGSQAKPFKTISAAAVVAEAGDTITVHEGIYREEINPPRGGTSDSKRITYQAAPGENVEIRGSEIVSGWTEESGGVWKTVIDNTLFGDFNPFADEITGDWFNPKGRKHHTGCVYQDGKWLVEAASKEGLKNTKWKKTWFAEVDDKVTTIWATFDGANPNNSLTEVNVRQTVFYPRKPFTNYITLRGFKMRHAAPKWAPPTAEQMGLIGTHWSKGWIIENNIISHSINTGISLGKYGDEFDNAGPTAQAYLDSIDRARANGWNKATVGSHIIRNNEISWCEQAGIVGSMGASFSKITGNYIHNIFTQMRFTGAEMAGIKFHAPIDMLIKDNRIHDAFQGIWLDWMTQGTRVTGNLCYSNLSNDMFLEVNHGPFVIDNNLFLSRLVKHHSQGGAYAHNLFGGVFGACTDARHTPYFQAHNTVKVDDHVLNVGDDRFYNNIFNGNNGSHIDKGWMKGMKTHANWRFGFGLWVYDTRPQAPQTAGNIYYDGAKPYSTEDAIVVKTKPDIKIEEVGSEVFLHINIDPQQQNAKTKFVTGTLLGKAQVPDLPFEDYDGSPLKIDTDYFGKKRDLNNPSSGPFEKTGSGQLKLKVWPKNTKEKSQNLERSKKMKNNEDFTFTKQKALDIIKDGFTAGEGYGEVWIRDYNTFIELAAEVFDAKVLKENLLVFFRMQGDDGNIIDGFIPKEKAGTGGDYKYTYSDLEPRYAAHKNTVETDQESSLVQTVYKYIDLTGDKEFLNETIGTKTVADRLEWAFDFLMNHRYDKKHGLIFGATTADWSDVQPEHHWGVFLTDDTHYALDIYDNAMFLIALDNFIELIPAKKNKWQPVRDQIAANTRKHLWDDANKKFIPHIYLDGSPFPEDFDENEIFYHGGTAVAIEAGLLSKEESKFLRAYDRSILKLKLRLSAVFFSLYLHIFSYR